MSDKPVIVTPETGTPCMDMCTFDAVTQYCVFCHLNREERDLLADPNADPEKKDEIRKDVKGRG